MVLCLFLHYSAQFLLVFPCFTHTRCTFFMICSFVCACLCFHFLHVAFHFFMLSFHGALFLCHTSYSLCFYNDVLFSYCSFFFSCCVFSSCRTFFIFSSFPPRWSLFMLHYFHIPFFNVALFSCRIFNSLHCSFYTFLTFSLISLCAFFMWLFLHVVSLLQLFHVTLFDAALFSCCIFPVCCIPYVSFSFLYLFHIKLVSDYTILFCIFSCFFLHTTFFMFEIKSFWTLPYCRAIFMFSFVWFNTHFLMIYYFQITLRHVFNTMRCSIYTLFMFAHKLRTNQVPYMTN